MINHVVLFKLNDYPESEKEKIRDELKVMLEDLKNKIEEVKYIEVGVNFEIQAKSFDMVLISHFNNLEDFDIYRVHPEHLKVVERIKETTSDRSAVDYIF